MKVLADTSVWVDYLRHGAQARASALDGLLAQGDVVLCGPVAAELVAGTRPGQREELWGLLSTLDWAPLERAQWRQVGELASVLRSQGSTTALTDLEIAVSATAADADLWSYDTDFARVGEALPELRRFTG